LDLSGASCLSKWGEEFRWSFRRVENLLRVSFTIALLDRREVITQPDLDEARAFRSPESLI
ncbi:MAG: hypothetical protein ACKN9V_05670, partial [Pseudomonadota bacterium]